MKRLRYLIFIFIGLTGCSKGSSQFANILNNPNGTGTGTSSISITSYIPASASVTVKETDTENFLVSATGQGTLQYSWTVDGAAVGSNSPSYSLIAPNFTVANHTVKVVINDNIGTTSQTWSVKVNGPPVIGTSTPSVSTVSLQQNTALSYSVSATDPNNDTLTYVWKLDGQSNILTSTTNTVTWTPTATQIGAHTISVDIYDGPISDPGTYDINQSWTTNVNNFSNACNNMQDYSETNTSCVLVGIPGIGDGLNPALSPSSIYITPTAFAQTSNGDLFIADAGNHVIWYYNLYSSPSTTVLGVTVPINTMKVVAGVGMASSGNSASTKALRNFLNSPNGIYYDGSNLYIADTNNNRILKVDNTGTVTSVLTSGCNSPRQMTIVGSYLYVACYSSNIIKAINTSTLAATTFAGTGSAGNPANTNQSSFTDPTDGVLNGPYGIAADSAGDIFVGEYGGCRIRMYNQSGATVTLYGSYSISNNMQRIIVGTSGSPSCTHVTGNAVSGARTYHVRSLSFVSPTLLTWTDDMSTVSAVNFSTTSDSLFGVAIPSYYAQSMLGTYSGYIGEGLLPNQTRFNVPNADIIDPNTGNLYIADTNNLRLRRFLASNNKTELVAGNGSVRGQSNAGQGQVNANQEKMYGIFGLAVDHSSGEIFVSDSYNNRIRDVNVYGQVTQAAGTGAVGLGQEQDAYPSNVTMNQPRGLVLIDSTASFGGDLVWVDSQNDQIRLYNRGSTDQTFFGVTVPAGMVATIAGNGSPGDATSGSALTAAFNNPTGVTFDGTNLYVADTNNSCVKMIDPSGNLSVVAGTCGSAGNLDGYAGTGRLNGPQGIDYYSNGTHQGILIADSNNGRIRFYRIAGTSTLLFGTVISVGQTVTIGCGGTFHDEGINATLTPCNGVYDVATVGTQACFTNMYYHNARCITQTGQVNTVLGGPEGISNTTPLYGPGGSFANSDYDPLNPNYTSQNGVTAFLLPSPIAEPSLTSSYGQVVFPRSIRAIDSATILVGEFYLGLIREVKLP